MADGLAESEATVNSCKLARTSGDGERDHSMHRDVLESARFPEAVFSPDRVTGQLALTGESEVAVHRVMRIHGRWVRIIQDIVQPLTEALDIIQIAPSASGRALTVTDARPVCRLLDALIGANPL
jgi:hypothetical protein